MVASGRCERDGNVKRVSMAVPSSYLVDNTVVDYYRELERSRYCAAQMSAQDYARQRAYEYDRQRAIAAQQQQGFYQPPQQLNEAPKAKVDNHFTSNKKLLLLEI